MDALKWLRMYCEEQCFHWDIFRRRTGITWTMKMISKRLIREQPVLHWNPDEAKTTTTSIWLEKVVLHDLRCATHQSRIPRNCYLGAAVDFIYRHGIDLNPYMIEFTWGGILEAYDKRGVNTALVDRVRALYVEGVKKPLFSPSAPPSILEPSMAMVGGESAERPERIAG